MSEKMTENLIEEQSRVKKVMFEIDKKSEKLLKQAGKINTDVSELRKTFWEDVSINLDEPNEVIETYASIKQRSELLSERERSHGQLDKQQATLSRMKKSPYFGRIDFKENGENDVEQVYIGIASFMDEKDDSFLIYDWRAPISSMYYDFGPGPAYYGTSMEDVSGNIELKRQFVIRDGEMKAMFDTGVTIGDEMLQEVLGNNANTQMKSIVATIQREQNKIIRNENSKVLIVQGVAGSGKTSAALQRVAYLLYHYRETLKSENILLFSPNPLFNSYVSTVLPELGEENMVQTTFLEYLNHRLGRDFDLEDPFSQMEYLLTCEDNRDYRDRLNSIRYKAGLSFKNRIDQYVESKREEGLKFKDIRFRNSIIMTADEIYEKFYLLDKTFSIPNRIEAVKRWLLKELKKIAKTERKKEWVEEEIQYLEKEDYLEAYQELQKRQKFSDNSFDDFEMESEWLSSIVVNQRFKPIINKVKKLKFIDHVSMYKEMLEELRSKGDEEEKSAAAFTLSSWTANNLHYEDAAPFLYLQDLIEGRKSNSGVRHIFIDEAQDYTPFQLSFIKLLFPYSKMTLLGDFNQAIYSGATESSTAITELEWLNSDDDVEKISLMRTYRSTKQIVEFTKDLISGGEDIHPFNRVGSLPEIWKGDTAEKQIEITLTLIKKMLAADHKTIAVICRTAQNSRKLYEALKEHITVSLVEKGTIKYEKGITVIPAYLAKGIEFDGVILYDSSDYRSERDTKLFYTAATRAMHELYLISSENTSPLLHNIDQHKYRVRQP